MDIIEKLTSCVVPFVNREKWIHKTMVQAAKEISRLRDALQEIASWHGGCGVDWPQEMARKALDANRPGSPDSGGQAAPGGTCAADGSVPGTPAYLGDQLRDSVHALLREAELNGFRIRVEPFAGGHTYGVGRAGEMLGKDAPNGALHRQPESQEDSNAEMHH